jgi:DNA-binding transcriptional LysR family regulator
MALNNLDLNRLKCFQAVAEKGGLQEGAKRLNLTPSAVYQSIKKLEDDLQKHLFFRSGKKYVLTDEGRALSELFQRFLWDFSQFQELSQMGAGLEGTIRVGLPLNFSKSSFVPVMKRFHDLYPKVSFHLTVAETRRLMEQIGSFELDFAITDDSIPPNFLSKVVKQELLKEELVLVCSQEFQQSHLQALEKPKTMKDLPHLDYARNLPLIQRWYRLHYRRQVKITDFHVIDNVETMLAALRSGLGLGIIPKDLLATASLRRELHIIPVNGELDNQLFLVQEANYINSTLLKTFINFLQQSLDPGQSRIVI